MAKSKWRITIVYPSQKRTRHEFDTEAEARDRAEHLSSVHRCRVTLDRLEVEYICDYNWFQDGPVKKEAVSG